MEHTVIVLECLEGAMEDLSVRAGVVDTNLAMARDLKEAVGVGAGEEEISVAEELEQTLLTKTKSTDR
jgi:hypothetical protein